MRCPGCEIRLRADKADLEFCAICGTPLVADINDIFQYKKYGIIREVRPPQTSMAQDVWDLIDGPDWGTLLAEGGTGTGKSFAYLIPSLLKIQEFALTPASDEDRLAKLPMKKVVISTAKKILQDQLARDIPKLLERLHVQDLTRWGIMKGRANYACWRAEKEAPDKDRRQFQLFIDEARQKHQPADKNAWVGAPPDWWEDVSIENCVRGSSCPDYAYCQPHPQEWNVVVTNHHILAYDLAKGVGTFFGPYNTLVIDEAHNATEAFRGAFSYELRELSFERLLKRLNKDTELRDTIDEMGVVSALQYRREIEHTNQLFKLLYHKATKSADSNGQIDPAKIQTNIEELSAVTGKLAELSQNIAAAMISAGVGTGGDNVYRGMAYRMHKYVRRVNNIYEFFGKLDWFTENNAGAANNYILTTDENALLIQPVELGPIVGPALQKVPNLVITSATLSVADDHGKPSFEFQKEQFGIKDPVITKERIYPSPFDYDHNVVLYAPFHVPLPPKPSDPAEQRQEWLDVIGNEIVNLCTMISGDTFVLFSSKKDMLDMYDTCARRLEASGIPVILHSGDAATVKQEYDKTPHSVLFGLKSFWEGVDIPGNKLRQVIITKLPFPHPGNPIVAALSRKYNDFNRVFVPPMIFDMKQGTGRLIRCATDKGFIAVLDPRIWTGGGARAKAHLDTLRQKPRYSPQNYGKRLLDSLGLKTVVSDFTNLKTYVNYFFKEG